MFKISISGKAGAGKNTFANLLCDAIRSNILNTNKKYSFGPTWHKSVKMIAFADPIKKMVLTAYPHLPKKYLYGPSHYRNNEIPGTLINGKAVTVRDALINIGNMCRASMPNIWVQNFDLAFNKLKVDDVNIIIVPDLRFKNEFNYLKEMKFFQIRIISNHSNNINDISETDQDSIKNSEFDYVVYNTSTIDSLKNEADYIAQVLLRK